MPLDSTAPRSVPRGRGTSVVVSRTRTQGPVLTTRLRPGQEVPGTRYKVVRWLGEGSMGMVFEVEHLDLGRRAALKVLAPHLSASPRAAEAFRSEARASAQIGHANIVDVFDFAQLPDGRLTIAMELLDGVPLGDELLDGPITPSRTVAILRQVAKALQAAHSAGIIHRDVKPENIMLVSRDGRPDFAKLVDFGIAAVVGSTAHRRGVGTPIYMSPEAILNDEMSEQADLYSLGVCAYEMLTGRPPFLAEDVDQLLRAHLEAKPIPPSRHAVVPRSLEAVIMRCLQKDPEARYRNMREFEAALCEAQIKAGIRTEWDDLPLPELEDSRRESLARRMPQAPVPNHTRNRTLLFGLILGILTSSVAWASQRALPDLMANVSEAGARAEAETTSHELEGRAKEAAARALYIYPPVEDPQAQTAFHHVVALENLRDEAGKHTAARLRTEFAQTLTRLGDEYWEQDAGGPFAVDYYIQALLFESSSERARERAAITTGELTTLRLKAKMSGFSRAERIAAEPLQVLALEGDPQQNALRKMQARDGRSAMSNQRLRALGVLPSLPSDPHRPPTASTEPSQVPRRQPVSGPVLDLSEPNRRNAEALRAQAAASRVDTEAIKLYRRALDADPQYLLALRELAQLYFDAADYSGAVKYRRQAVRVSPKDSQLRIDLGDALYKCDRFSEARSQYARAQRLDHTEAPARLAKVAAILD